METALASASFENVFGYPVRAFYVGHSSATNVGAISDTGLGLSISKQVVELHGGEMVVESEVDKGSVFSVILPWAGKSEQWA